MTDENTNPSGRPESAPHAADSAGDRAGEQSAPGGPGSVPPPPPPPPPADAARRLRRSKTDRKVAGVCGGLGEYLDVDPVIFRVLFPVFAVFGGTGLLLYALAWLLIPDEGEERSEAQRLVEGHLDGGAALAAGAAVLGFLVLLGFMSGWPDNVFGLLVFGLALYFVIRLFRGDRRRAPGWPQPNQGYAGFAQTPGPAGPGDPTAPVPPWWRSATPPGTSASPGGAEEPTARMPHPYAPPPPRRPRERSVLTWVVLSLALIAAGVLLAADAAGAEVGAGVILATVLLVLAGGLIVSAWYGRARGLILPAVLVTLLLTANVGVNRLDFRDFDLRDGVGTTTWYAAEARSGPLYHAVGDVSLDLTELGQGQQLDRVVARVGIGELRVVLPPDLPVRVNVEVGAGQIVAPGYERDGTDVELHTTLVPPGVDGRSADPKTTLDLSVGTGNIHITYAPAGAPAPPPTGFDPTRAPTPTATPAALSPTPTTTPR
ncbi:hypothetical protein TH66_12575 [Carbonactinospora thermoautotrophica]|uniref:Phage shock protein PspC N-terminal domain-containing protein n=1 Tax=Carbonactinospora thermoautotrophica TaxID=1469144 RepID=A0A132N0J8_9ACTN|nr:PspC domain-containing protein [Carbonactinospora thermoautotrophica]KWX03659.1 hypothetical protein TH66_12575 [Carbonactinospora thermoautotrophica]